MIDTLEIILTILFSAVAVLAAVGFVVFRQPVHAALSFAAAVLAASGLYILQDAAYVAAATIVIYAGATIIIFLFVLMFAQHSHLQMYELKYSNLGVAAVASLCLVVLLCYAVTTRNHFTVRPGQQTQSRVSMLGSDMAASGARDSEVATREQNARVTESESETGTEAETAAPRRPGDHSVAALGRVTYTRYLWAIELAGTLLLIAAGGAIVIAQREPNAVQSTGVSL